MKCPKEHCEFETVHPKNMSAHVALMHPALNQVADEKPAPKKIKKTEVLTNDNTIDQSSQTITV